MRTLSSARPALRLAPLVFLALLSSASLGHAQSEVDASQVWRRPLASRNQTPFALFFVYLTPDHAASLRPGDLDLDIALDYSNIIQEEGTENEFLRFDLEYLRTLISMKRGFGHGIELGFEVPFYIYYGGFLDPFVDGLHEAFGLPNELRGQTPFGLVGYEFVRGEESIFSGRNTVGSVGEPTLRAKKVLFGGGLYSLSVRGALKFPTGNAQELSGSGATDFALGMAFDRIGPKYGLYLNAGYQFLGTPDRFETQDYVSFMVAADWRFKPRFAAVLQVDYMSPPVRGEVLNLTDPGMQLALGLRYHHSDAFAYEWRFVEDLSTFSPDFTFAFQWEVRSRGVRR
jgi:Protein of unknown function (DUF3187)